MPFTVVVGCQWGDEGKGKIVDLMAEGVDWVARFQGGANAGHTVFVGDRQAVLHLVPTGILRPDVHCAIGNGVVLDPIALLEELRLLEGLGIRWRDRLRISPFAHIVTPLHKSLEALRQQDRSIGTTRRGIGPAYEDKASRRGLRVEDLLDERVLRERLQARWESFRKELKTGEHGAAQLAAPDWSRFDELAGLFDEARRVIGPLVCDVTDLLLSEDEAGKAILCEGAQGSLLDIDHGTYPFVTSSNTTVGGACTGLGIPPRRIEKVVGIVKAYTTRVGLGPFPTEFDSETADGFREKAGEYGATTGRPRRCGWLDAVLVRRSVRINGVDELVVTKLDVLSGLDRLCIATEYRHGAPREQQPPGAPQGEHASGPAAGSTEESTWAGSWPSTAVLEQAIPEYAEVPGWMADLSGARALSDLPSQARVYLETLSREIGAPVGLVSIGPGREQVLATRS